MLEAAKILFISTDEALCRVVSAARLGKAQNGGDTIASQSSTLTKSFLGRRAFHDTLSLDNYIHPLSTFSKLHHLLASHSFHTPAERRFRLHHGLSGTTQPFGTVNDQLDPRVLAVCR